MDAKCLIVAVLTLWTGCTATLGAPAVEAPPGMFKDLDDPIVGDALILNGKQLFIDDYLIGELSGAEKILNQPVKHAQNPLIVPDQPWENQHLNRGSVMYDHEESIFKMWYVVYTDDLKRQRLAYATSKDGISWQKPIINEKDQNNIIPGLSASNPHCVFRDRSEANAKHRYKMLYGDNPDGTAKSLSTNAAYSPDGIHWTREPANPVIPFSDTLSCPYWDTRARRYVAYLRYGPPNTRRISRTESRDFVHWSPKVTVIGRTKIDDPFITKLYGMKVAPYEGIYIGLLEAYHGETIQPIPEDEVAWRDKVDAQLTFSRNGLTWQRVGRRGAIPQAELIQDKDWKTIAEQATFIPHGEHGKEWDWGSIYSFQPLLVFGDQIRIYYLGGTGRHWASYHGDPPRKSGIGLATLRLDGFVSIDAAGEGTLTTKTLVFLGDQIEVNADASGGSIQVEALDPDGNVIEGFSKEACTLITTDSIRHVLQWNNKANCQLIQARPIKLRFHLNKAKLYSFTPQIRHNNYIASYGNQGALNAALQVSAVSGPGIRATATLEVQPHPVNGQLTVEWDTEGTSWKVEPQSSVLQLVAARALVTRRTFAIQYAGDRFPLARAKITYPTADGEAHTQRTLPMPAYQRTTVSLMKSAPILDGQVTEQETAGLAREADMIQFDGSGAARYPTEFYTGLHGNRLYVAVINHEPDMDKIRIVERGFDGNLFADDSNEVFVQRAGTNDYYQFSVNAAGQKYDTKNGYLLGNYAWNGDWEVTVSHGEDRWVAEYLIGLDMLGPPLRPGQLLRLNLCRQNKIQGEYSQWSHTNGTSSHLPEFFGRAVVGGD